MSGFFDTVARLAFGMVREEAHRQGICIRCKRELGLLAPEDLAEYRISGFCPECFDEVMGAEEDDEE